MNAITVQKRPESIYAILITLFLPWYIKVYPLQIKKLYIEIMKEVWQICSFVFLLRTLFSPWKNIAIKYPKHAFDFAGILEAITTNVTARTIGAVLRICTIAFGICIVAVVTAAFLLYTIIWVVFPIIFATTIVLIIARIL